MFCRGRIRIASAAVDLFHSGTNAAMSLINFILNLAGLLLWFGWCAIRSDPFRQSAPATLAGTIRRAEAPIVKRWHFLAALGLLLLVRGFLYWQIGPAVNWTPRINLVVVVLAFRGDAFGPELLFSFLSFSRVLLVFYFWLLVLAMINRDVADPGVIHKLLGQQLGSVARWPRWIQGLLPVVVVPGFWLVLHPLLVHSQVMNPAKSMLHLFGQGILVGAAIYLSLKYLLPAILILHLLASYVYFGRSPAWDFIGTTARNILAPLKHFPLHYRKMDFAPLIGIVAILVLSNLLPIARWSAQRCFPDSNLAQFFRQFVLWPQ